MSRQILLVFLIVALRAVYGTKVTPCGGSATLEGIDVEGCVDSVAGPCEFVKGKSYKIKVNITANDEAGMKLPYNATAEIGGQTVTFFAGNSCELLISGQCPPGKGKNLVFDKEITVSDKFNPLESVMKLQIVDEKERVLTCANVKFAIKAP